MRLHVFAVRDVKVGSFNQPLFCRSEGEARRLFQDEVNREDKDNILYRHPSDFSLFKLGVWDSESGQFELAKLPELVVEAAAVRIDEDRVSARISGVN